MSMEKKQQTAENLWGTRGLIKREMLPVSGVRPYLLGATHLDAGCGAGMASQVV